MQNLERRVCVLEQAAPPAETSTVFITFALPGHPDAEPQTLHSQLGEHWARAPGETLEGFKARAAGEAMRSEFGVAVLIEG